MRKIKKINGYLIVKFNDREKRLNEDTSLGEYGIIDAERYTGRLSVDRKAMAFDNAYTLDEAVELARSLEAEIDINDEPTTYTVIVEGKDFFSEKEIEPQAMINKQEDKLVKQIESSYCPTIDNQTAIHVLRGYKAAFCDLGLLPEDEFFVNPDIFKNYTSPIQAENWQIVKEMKEPPNIDFKLQTKPELFHGWLGDYGQKGAAKQKTEGKSMTQKDTIGANNINTGLDLVSELVLKIVPVLAESAAKALQLPEYEGIEFAALLLEEAVRYGSLYPRAFGVLDNLIITAAKKFRQWNTDRNGFTGAIPDQVKRVERRW